MGAGVLLKPRAQFSIIQNSSAKLCDSTVERHTTRRPPSHDHDRRLPPAPTLPHYPGRPATVLAGGHT